MARIEILKQEIASFFSQLSTDITNEKAFGKINRIHDLENYIKDFLNILHDLEDEDKFINLNAKTLNAEGVDLFSPGTKHFIQVTVTNSGEKFKDAINKTSNYIRGKGVPEEDCVFTFFTFEKFSYSKKNQVIQNYNFKDVRFLNKNDIIRQIDSSDVTKLERIHNIVRTDYRLDLTVLERIVKTIHDKGKLKHTGAIPQPYDICDKIEFNNLEDYKDIILKHVQYSRYVEQVIAEYEDKAEYDIKNSIVETISHEYLNIKHNHKMSNSDEIMFHLINNIKEMVKIPNIPVDITLYVTSLVVYVFCECRIFKSPRIEEKNYDN